MGKYCIKYRTKMLFLNVNSEIRKKSSLKTVYFCIKQLLRIMFYQRANITEI